MEEKKKSNAGLIIIIVLLLIICLGMGGFIFVNKDKLFDLTKADVETNETEEKEEKEVVPAETKLSETEALSLGKELWDYAYDTYWGGEKAWKSHTEVNNYGGQSIVCDTSREEVKAKYTTDFVAEAPGYKYYLDEFIPKNGCESGRGGDQYYKETKITIKEIDDEKITYTATVLYCSNVFCNDSASSPNKIKEIPSEFIIVKQDNNWLIKYFYLPN